MRIFIRVTFLLLSLLSVSKVLMAQLPPSICSPQGGTRGDIIDIQTAYRAPAGAHPTFTIPAGATGVLLSISSHSSDIASPSSDERLGDEDFITVSADIDLQANTSSGIINFARSTITTQAETNLYSWLKVPFGVNVSSQKDKGQSTPVLLNDLTISRSGNQLTVQQSSNVIHSSYLLEFISPTDDSFIENGTSRVIFTGGTPNVRTATVPANTNFIVISRKGTVRISNYDSNGGTEEGYSDERILIDIDKEKLFGYSTVANGADIAFRSTYVIQDHDMNSTTRFTSTGNVTGDFAGKSTTSQSTAPASDVGLSNSAIYFSGTAAAGGILTIDELPAYTNAFDGVYVIEYYRRVGLGMSVSFIDTRTAFIAKGQGTTAGTARDISIPAGADFIFLRQAGNASNSPNAHNENSMEAYAVIDLNTETASGYYYQQVGFTNSTTRRDDNYGFLNLPLDGTSTRNPTYSAGYYTSPQQGGAIYDLDFELSANKSVLRVTNAYGLVASEYQTITEARFFGRRPDLAFSTDVAAFVAANNGTCEDVAVTVEVCNPGSGNSPGDFPVSFYDKDPTVDGTAKLLHIGNYENAIIQGDCNTYNFSVDLKSAGYDNPNITIYCVINDDGSYTTGGIGTTVGTPFTLASLATQDPNSNYIECDYTNNLFSITIQDVMACPTVVPQITTNQKPILNGTWDNINAQPNGLTVTVNSITYTLGTDPELTVSGNQWTLDLSGIPTGLPLATYPVTAVSINSKGTATDGTTNELIITDVGSVFLDFNGLSDNVINGIGSNTIGADALYINIIDVSNNVAAVISINPSGTYSIPAIANGDYVFQLTINQGTLGNPKPVTALPASYVYTGEGVAANGDGTPDGEFAITIDNMSVLVPNFGFQQRPTSGAPDEPGIVLNDVVQGTRFNPGVFGGFEIPTPALGGGDDDGVRALLLESIPSNLLSISHNGVTYFKQVSDVPSVCPTASCIVIPVDGIEIPTNSAGQPLSAISYATDLGFIDGTIELDYKTVDAAGFSSDATTLSIPMVALKFQSGEWHNGSTENGEPLGSSATAANMPDEDDNDKTLFWIDNDGTLTKSAVVRNLQIFPGVTATVDNGACLTVNESAIGGDATSKLALKAQSDQVFAQYLGAPINAAFEMVMEQGFHNIGFPVDITIAEWADQNNDAVDHPFVVNLTNDPETHNLTWYDSQISSGIQQGFFINRDDFEDTDNMLYSAHAYGTWNLAEGTENAKERGYNYAINSFMAPLSGGNYTLVAEGPTNASSQTYSTSDNWGGWNLIPNIYPITISTSDMFADGFFDDFDKAVWVWDPRDTYDAPIDGRFSSGAYRAFDVENNQALAAGNSQLVNSEANIAPFQAFYIRRTTASQERRDNEGGGALNAPGASAAAGVTVDDATGVTGTSVTVTMKPEYRTNCGIKAHYKTQALADILMVQATDKGTQRYDMLELAFASHYSNGIDVGLDIAKQGVANGPQPLIFTSINNTALVINKMNYPNEGTSVPMGFYAKEDGREYEIAMVKHPGVYSVYLEDLKTGTWTDLTRNAYSFVNDVKFNLHRFRIHFKLGSASIDDFHPGIRAWAMSEGIKVQFHNLIVNDARIRITDAVGRVLFDGSNITTREDFIYPTAQMSKGMYTVTVITAEQTITEKIIR